MKEFVQGKDLNGVVDETIQFSQLGYAVSLAASGTGSVVVPPGAKKAYLKVGGGSTVLFGTSAISAVPGATFSEQDYDILSYENEMRFVNFGETLHFFAVDDSIIKVSFYI